MFCEFYLIKINVIPGSTLAYFSSIYNSRNINATLELTVCVTVGQCQISLLWEMNMGNLNMIH